MKDSAHEYPENIIEALSSAHGLTAIQQRQLRAALLAEGVKAKIEANALSSGQLLIPLVSAAGAGGDGANFAILSAVAAEKVAKEPSQLAMLREFADQNPQVFREWESIKMKCLF